MKCYKLNNGQIAYSSEDLKINEIIGDGQVVEVDYTPTPKELLEYNNRIKELNALRDAVYDDFKHYPYGAD